MPSESFAFRLAPAQPGDETPIVAMIRELAEYERLAHECVIAPEALREHLFGPEPCVRGLVAWVEDEPVGYALYFTTYSTFLGRPGLYLEDIYVRPAHRQRGIGGALLRRLGDLCAERGYGRMEWSVLTWNELAASQYRKIGAAPLADWRTWRLTGDALAQLRSAAPEAVTADEGP